MNKFFGDKKFYGRVLAVAVPIMIQNGITNFVNMLDNIMVGQLGTDPISGVAIINQLMFVFNLCLFGALSGIGIFTAQYYGKGDHEGVRYTFRMQVITGAIVILIGLFAFLKFGDAMVLRFLTEDSGGGSVEGTLEYAHMYMMFLMMEVIPFTAVQVYANTLRNTGETVVPMRAGIVAVFVNLIGNYVLIYGKFGAPALGVRGAAIATVIGNALSTAFFLWIYMSGRSLLKPDLRLAGFSGRIMKEIMAVGTPHTLEQFLSTASILVLNNLAAAYGGLTVAAMGISSKIMSFGNYIYQGITAGCQPLMGYNYGAKNYRRLRNVVRAGILVVTAAEILIMAAGALAAPALIGLFSKNEEVIAIGKRTLRAAVLILPFVGTTAMVRNLYNSIGKPMYAFLITVIRQLVLYIPFLLLFNRLWGYGGLIHAQPAEEALCLVVSAVLLRRTMNNLEQE